MICANCRTANLKGMLFCAKCGRSLQSVQSDETLNVPRLVWQVGEGTPQTYLLTKAVTTIGRVSGNDIILPETGVSRQHTRIERDGGRFAAVDLGSLNGTYVNEERVEQERELSNGDVIQIGHTSLQVFLPAAFQHSLAAVGPRRLMDSDTIVAAGRTGAASDSGPITTPEPPVPSVAVDDEAHTVYDIERLVDAPPKATAVVPTNEATAPTDEALPPIDEALASFDEDLQLPDLDALDDDVPSDPAAPAAEHAAAEHADSEVEPMAEADVAVDHSEDATVRADLSPEDIAAAPLDEQAPAVPKTAYWLSMGDATRIPIDDVVSVGRGETNTIVLSQDRQVSRHHARFQLEGDELRLEDLGSANGTFLNGERVTATALVEGDEVRIGGTTLRVERGSMAPAEEPVGDDSTIRADTNESTLFVEDEDSSDKTISELEFDAELAALGEPLPRRTPHDNVVESTDRPRLNVTWGPQSGESFVLDREVVLIGRGGGKIECDIALQDKSISSPHAKLVQSGDLYLLHDLESTNGTFVNYEHLRAPRVLQDGDLIKVGKTTLLFRTPVVAAPPTPSGGWAVPTLAGQGKMITFFSLKGGSGTTTLAVNTALLIRELTGQPTLLVDLALERASVTSQMNLELRRTIDHFAELPHVDQETVRGMVSHHSTGLDVLAAPTSPQTAELVSAELLAQLFPLLKQEYQWIVIDTAATFSDLNLNAFDQSDLVALVAAPDLVSLRTMQSCMDVFTALQTTGERRLLVLNNVYPKPRLERDEMEKALGERVDLALPYGEEVLLSIDLGVPLTISTREHPFVQALDGFVRKVAEIQEAPVHSKAARGGLWLKLKGMLARR